MDIKQGINKSGLRLLRKLTDVNKIVSDDINIISRLKQYEIL